jgi:hypothetical protein
MVFGYRQVSPNGKFTIHDYDSILQRIKTVCDNPKYNSRTFAKDNPLSILAFLPCGKIPIELVSEAFKRFLEDNNIIPEFEILAINSKVNAGTTAISRIDDAMQKVRLTGKKGLLILAGRQCSMGVTIKHCDIVLLLNSCSSFDMLYQMMFRCMSEDVGKKCGFVVDINVQRVVDTLIDYALKINPRSSAKEALKYILEQRLINLNADEWMGEYFGCKGLNIESLVGKVYDIWTSKPSNAIKRVLDVLQFKFDMFNKNDQALFNQLFNATKAKSSNEIRNVDKDLNKGIKETPLDDRSIGSIDKEVNTEDTVENQQDKNVNFIRDILRHLIPLICLLSIHYTERTTFEEMCQCIHEDKRLKEIFMDQIRLWWSKGIPDEVFTIFINMYNKYLKDNTEIYQVITRVKELFSRSLHNQKELAKLIDEYLVPQELEKKQNAEVSTPHHLRKDMLDALEKYVPDFFKTPKRVFEPCCGKGQFVVDIIDRFMVGLNDVIPNDQERYRKIVEDCIYFADINSTNIYIVRLLLDPFGQYKLNYFEGDTLKLDITKQWGIQGFEGVIGNPPYQNSQGASNGTLWDKFVELALNRLIGNGHVCYIHPSGWRNVSGKFKKLQDQLKQNNMIYLEIHNESDGLKNFKAETRYDWYVLQNSYDYKGTDILFEDGQLERVDVRALQFIPNGAFQTVQSLIATDEQEKCNVLYDRTSYGCDKQWMSKDYKDAYIYPCVYTINSKNELKLHYSTHPNGNGMGLPKLMWSNGRIKSIGSVIDVDGTYGLTQFAYGIVDIPENLPSIKKAFDSHKFRRLMEYCAVCQLTVNYKIIGLFRKDFWKEFV